MDRDGLLALFDRLIAPHAGVERKGKTMPYTALGGNMFSFVDPGDRLCLRLGDADRADWAAEWTDEPVMQYGSVMRGYVSVPEALLADETALEDWFARAVSNARALKPKQTARRKQN